ncbi:hypothetical protein CEQ90_17105 [Lewinellaceae bacterium SD302]|nr:hypothetical protein CEQ90_17105 [Lewinellaceae bacterium SD302]
MKSIYLKLLIAFIILSVFTTPIKSQIVHEGLDVVVSACDNCLDANPTNIADSTFYTRNIISDFGPRARGGYDFHGGIDFTAEGVEDRGYGIYPVEDGTVRRVRVGAGQKYVEITGEQATLMYNHLFNINGLGGIDDGDIELVELDRHPVGVLYEYGVLSLRNNDTSLIVVCNNDCNLSYKIVGNDTIYGTNQVTTNTIIGSLGISAGSDNNPQTVAPHLHLQRFLVPGTYGRNNLIDPLEILRHQGPDYEATFHHRGASISNPNDGVLLSYPGHEPSEVMVRAVMPDSVNGVANNGMMPNWTFRTNTMNVDRVELYYILEGDSVLLRGNELDAKIWMGARFYEHDHYPMQNNPNQYSHIQQGWFSNTVGTIGRQGIRPIAYSNRNGRWDDYYFTDILTRVNKNDFNNGGDLEPTSCPANALISDGPNNLIARITSVRDIESEIESPEFYVDNFKPFIKSVVASIGNKEVYAFEWTCADDEDCEGISSSGGFQTFETIDNNDIEGGFIVSVTTSEPLHDLALTLSNYCIITDCPDITQQGITTDQMTWSFQFSGIPNYFSADSTDNSSEIWSMTFEGHDFSPDGTQGQPLLNLSESFNPANDPDDNAACVNLPHRTSLNSWSSNDIPQGEETAHYFQFSCGQGLVSDNAIRINCCELEITGGFIRPYELSECDANDGSIQVLQLHWTGNDGPVTQHWERNGIIMAGENGNLSNLSIGTYCKVLTDESGCRADTCFVIGYQNGVHPYVTTTLGSACAEESPSGNVNIQLIPNFTEPPYYTLICSNGDTLVGPNGIFGETYDFYNLLPGPHTITIIDPAAPDCPLVENINIEIDDSPNPPFTITATDTEHPCPDAENGKAKIYVAGGRPPYTYDWGVVSHTYSSGIGSLPNIGEGEYCVTVTESCGESVSECFELWSLSQINVIPADGCGSTGGSASVTAQFGNLPYSYQWSNGATVASPQGLSSGTYGVFVFDAEGCYLYDEIQIQNAEFAVEIENTPCENFIDGLISVEVTNPNNEEVSLNHDGTPVFIPDPTASSFTVSIDGLEGDQNHEIEIVTEDCRFNESIFLDAIPISEVFSDIQGDSICIFDQFCGDELILEESSFDILQWPIVVDDSNPLFSPCVQVGRCNGQEVTARSADYITAPVGVFRSYVNSMHAQMLIDDQDRNIALEGLSHISGNECNKITFCPLTLHALGTFWFIDHHASSTTQGSDGCTEIECPWYSFTNDYNLCDEVAPILTTNFPITFSGSVTPFPTLPANCDIVENSLYQLVLWQDQLTALFGEEFNDTDLGELINTAKSTQEDSLNSICARVLYCSNTFEVIDHDLNSVDCDDFDPSTAIISPCWYCSDNCFIAPDETMYVVCNIDGTYRSTILYDSLNIDVLLGESTIPEPSPIIIQVNQTEGTFFKNLQFVQQGNHLSSKLSIDSADISSYIDFTPYANGNSRKSNDQTLSDLYIDYDNDYRIFLYKNSDQQWVVEGKYLNNSFLHVIEGSFVDLNISIGSDIPTITCRSNGNLVIDDQQINGYTKAAFSEFSINTDGTYLLTNRMRFLEELGPNDQISMIENHVALSIESEKSVELNGGAAAYTISSDSTYFLSLRDESKLAVPQILADVSKVKAISSHNNIFLTSLKTSGAQVKILQFNNQTLSFAKDLLASNGGEVVSVTSQISTSGLSVIGITFTGDITFDGNFFSSNGLSDVLFLVLDNQGNIVSSKHYGSPDTETVEEIKIYNGIVHFGGNYSGEYGIRKIGNMDYLQLPIISGGNTSFNRPYVSYFSLTDTTSQAKSKKPQIKTPIKGLNSSESLNINTAKFFPNPTDEIIYLELSTKTQNDRPINVDIFRIDGTKALSEQFFVGTHPINLALEKGKMLFYRVVFADGSIDSGKLILNE